MALHVMSRSKVLTSALLRRRMSTAAAVAEDMTFASRGLHPATCEKQGEVIVVTSGKGGVGKTTSAASIGYGLARNGHKTCLIDFDIGLRNLDLHLVM